MINSMSFEKNLDLLQRSLTVSSLRDKVHANNIANVETPNFKRTRVSFESELATALKNERLGVNNLELKRTSAKHFKGSQAPSYSDVQPRLLLDSLTTARNNGNNVDIDVEVQQALENQMLYTMLTQVAGHEFRQIDIVLR